MALLSDANENIRELASSSHAIRDRLGSVSIINERERERESERCKSASPLFLLRSVLHYFRGDLGKEDKTQFLSLSLSLSLALAPKIIEREATNTILRVVNRKRIFSLRLKAPSLKLIFARLFEQMRLIKKNDWRSKKISFLAASIDLIFYCIIITCIG